MKLKYKKLLLATLATATIYQPISIAYAEDVDVVPTETSNNTVEVNETEYTINGTTTELEDDDNYQFIYGGYPYGASSSGNTVNILGGIFTSDNFIYGGYSNLGNVSGNKVIINVDDNLYYIYGGYAFGDTQAAGSATNNTITIHKGTFSNQVIGGYSFSRMYAAGNATGNTVTINSGTFNNDVWGGVSVSHNSTNGNSNRNTVEINDGTFNGYVGGGDSSSNNGSGSADNNEVTINSGTFNNSVIGGRSTNGNVTSNTLIIKGGTFQSVIGGITEAGNATNNIINIYGSPDLSSSTLIGGYTSRGTSSGNTLNIYTKNLIAQNISYFQNMNFYLGDGITNGSTMLTLTNAAGTDISGTNIAAVMQGGSPLTDGDTVTLLTNANGVTEAKSYTGTIADGISTVKDLTVSRSVDGKSIIAKISGGDDPVEPVIHDSNNIVNIDSTFSGDVYGGWSDDGDSSNNVVNLYGGTNLGNIYGGYAPNGSTTGNSLNVLAKNIIAKNIYNFDNLNFYVPSDAINGETMLTLTDTAGTNISGMNIKAGIAASNRNLQIGDTINLLTNPSGLNTIGAIYGKLNEGVSLAYDLDINRVGNSVVANITSSPNSLNPQTEILPVSGELPAIGVVETAFNTKTFSENPITDSEDENKDDSGSVGEIVNVPVIEPKGWELFANMGGGSLRIKGSDGSHVDMTTQSVNLGFARSLENSAGRFTIAPIIDYVSGNYDSYLESGIHGSGKTRYIAGGLIARRMLNNGFYYETSFRVGKVKTDFASDDLDKTGIFGRVTYDTSATTLSGHLKLGKGFRLNKNNFLDIYGIYYHAHQGGMDVDLSSGEHYNFSSANSGRARIGYRLTTRTSKISQIYTGLAFQYEHSTGVTATYKTYKTEGKGDSGYSGMLELGWIIRPLKALPWAVDINTTGWIGHQRGITAMAKIQKAF